MVYATNLGYPRIGPKRELKNSLEQFWAGELSQATLLEQATALRKHTWDLQQQLGLQHIPSNDFSLYDHVLDTIAMVGAVPKRYQWQSEHVDLPTYFAMARGIQDRNTSIPAMEMTKWFDTNYHYIVPEFEQSLQFRFASSKVVDEFKQAQAFGIHTRPVVLGPVSFLLLGKSHHSGVSPLTLLPQLLPIYAQVLQELAAAGADWIQLDEPCLVLDLDRAAQQAIQEAYTQLSTVSPKLRLLLVTYFGNLGENLPLALQLPIAGLHLDLVRAPEQLTQALASVPATLSLSLGLIDGRNIWRTNLEQALGMLEQAVQVLGTERVLVAPSCSLLHVPLDLQQETQLDDELRSWLAFAQQKLEEVVLLTKGSNAGQQAIASDLEVSRQAFVRRRQSPRIHNAEVAQRLQTIVGVPVRRHSSYLERHQSQQQHLHLPLLPTTTIGSFPQTTEVRAARAAHNSGKLSDDKYLAFLRKEIEQAIHFQEEIGLDVLVHGEPERNDMVAYFGEQLEGFLFTQYGWVQSYGSRCVRPPIILGDVVRKQPMTVEWALYAQSLTKLPVKGMLTGPVTILEWSFVRDDQPREQTCYQLALAIRDEVQDLEAAGIGIIQIDEPALREGLPLRRADWNNYLSWAINCFRLTSSDVRDQTQIHTHMCYAEFDDIIEQIEGLDADVISIEASRSQLDVLDTFVTYHYPSEIGPGIYDIHSPRVPSSAELEATLRNILRIFPPEQVWVNPDCGLKTRRWEEVRPALANLVAATNIVRASLSKHQGN